MTYTQLKANIQDIVENEFTDDQLAMFTTMAEQTIYNTVELPVFRKEDTGIVTVNGTDTITLPTDFLYMYSFAVVNASNQYVYLINKDENFIHEAYPVNATTGTPKHYALLNSTTAILGPTPDAVYTTEIQYGAYPTSIVTAGTTWLGQQFETALLNGALIEAARFTKAEADVLAMYETLYTQAITLLRNLGAGKLRQDMYRSGEYRTPPK